MPLPVNTILLARWLVKVNAPRVEAMSLPNIIRRDGCIESAIEGVGRMGWMALP